MFYVNFIPFDQPRVLMRNIVLLSLINFKKNYIFTEDAVAIGSFFFLTSKIIIITIIEQFYFYQIFIIKRVNNCTYFLNIF